MSFESITEVINLILKSSYSALILTGATNVIQLPLLSKEQNAYLIYNQISLCKCFPEQVYKFMGTDKKGVSWNLHLSFGH